MCIRKPSFWVLVLLVPALLALLYALPVILSSRTTEKVRVLVVDETKIFNPYFKSTDCVVFQTVGSLSYAQHIMDTCQSSIVTLHIPKRETTIPSDAFLYYHSQLPSRIVQTAIDHQLQTILRNIILSDVHGINADDYYQLSHTAIRLNVKDVSTGRDAFLQVKMALGCVLSLLIVMAVIFLGSRVLRGVAEEKGSRIAEILLCSVRPFQLMMGKVLGLALVGLLQFFLWTFLTTGALWMIRHTHEELFAQAESSQLLQISTKGDAAVAQMQAAQIPHPSFDLMQGIVNINFPLVLSVFLVYFVLGYLLYSAMFAAVGAGVDSEADAHHFVLPLVSPLLLSLGCLPLIFDNPSGAIATTLSIIPFTSPVAMLLRLPFGVSVPELLISTALLLLTVFLCIWFAARFYRLSILRYGKSVQK